MTTTLTFPEVLEMGNTRWEWLKLTLGPLRYVYGFSSVAAYSPKPMLWTGVTDQEDGSTVTVSVNGTLRKTTTVSSGAFSFRMPLELFGEEQSDGTYKLPNNIITLSVGDDSNVYAVDARNWAVLTTPFIRQAEQIFNTILKTQANFHLYDVDGREYSATYKGFYDHWGYYLDELTRDSSISLSIYKAFIRSVFFYLNNEVNWDRVVEYDTDIRGAGCYDGLVEPMYELLGERPQVWSLYDKWVSGMNHYLPIEVDSYPSLTVEWGEDFSRYFNKKGVLTLPAGSYTLDVDFEGWLYLDGSLDSNYELEIQTGDLPTTGIPYLDFWPLAYVVTDATKVTSISENGVLDVDTYGEQFEQAKRTIILSFQNDYADEIKAMAFKAIKHLKAAYVYPLLKFNGTFYDRS